MKKITISLNPTYLCNFRCDFCYLTKVQLKDRKVLDLAVLRERLSEIKASGYLVNHVDLYGGEISLLENCYLEEMDQILFKEAADPTINVITNLSKVHPYFLKEHVDLSVSFDFEAREKHEIVLSNILTTNKNIAILMLASSELIALNTSHMIETFSSIQNIVSVEIKPYSSNQANQHQVSDLEFEDFIKKWISSEKEKKFDFINEENIKLALQGRRNAFSDDHIYINPNGKISVLEFDQNGDEYFLELDSFQEYLVWTQLEKKRVYKNKICSDCDYLGKCLTEHYREVVNIKNSCNGFKGLLDHYKNHIL